MKKIVILAIAVSLLMVGGFVAFLYTMGKSGEKLERELKERNNAELGIVSLQGEHEYKTFNTQTEFVDLILSGENANVMNPAQKTPADVYSVATSQNVHNQLARMEDKKDYDFENPLIALNPYGTFPNSLYMFFETKSDCYLKYTITVQDENIPDFTRTMNDSDGSGYSKHEYMITGFVPGMENYLCIELVSDSGDYVDSRIYKINVPGSVYGNPVAIPTEMSKKVEHMSNGLFFCYGMGNNSIALYDNSGYLRGEIPLIKDSGVPIFMNTADMLIPYSDNGFARVTRSGQVTGVYSLGNYTIDTALEYNEMGQMLAIASDSDRKTMNDLIISIDLDNGKVKEEADMQKILKKVYKNINKGKKKPDKKWLMLDSLKFINGNDLIVSTGKMSSILCIGDIMSANPTLKYIIGSKDYWNDYKGYKDKLLIKQTNDEQEADTEEKEEEAEATPEAETEIDNILEPEPEEPEIFEDFKHNVGMVCEVISGSGDSEDSDSGARYYISLVENGVTPSKLQRYLINEEDNTYRHVSERELPEGHRASTLQLNVDNSIIYDKTAGRFCEYGKEGVPIISYTLPAAAVYKNSMKEFWFR